MRRQLFFGFIALLIAVSSFAAERRDLLVSTLWLEKHLKDADVTIIDVSDSDAYIAGHIPGAKFVPARDLVTTRDGIPNEIPDVAKIEEVFQDAGVSDKGRIVIYSRKLIPAARAFMTLEYLGRRGDCALLDGGYAKWAEEKHPVDTGMKLTTLGTFKAHPDPNVIVKFDAMKGIVDGVKSGTSKDSIADARDPQFYSAAEAGEEITRAGHIPGAVNVPDSKVVTTDAAPVFKTAEELKAQIKTAGVRDDGTVVTYCRTGMEASVDYFVLRYLGRDAQLYDGSYFEWSGKPDLPVVGKQTTN